MSKIVPKEEYKAARQKQQEAKKEAYDRGTSMIKPFAPGHQVWLNKTGRANERWIKATVTSIYKESNNCSVTVKTEDGAVYRRNRKFIQARPTTNKCTYLQNNVMPLMNMEVPMEPEPLCKSPQITSPPSDISQRFSRLKNPFRHQEQTNNQMLRGGFVC
ncbi:hypothetical protein QYM36_013071 [Artemia franciscana]|uniref:Uncharacterized protein n=1 Tax=Artemia franciscana TaxID=6661 RepID=A0AA88HKH9_ARTSF|nr:hypothetical protein QYM36_013071 [Artemia franciscana]